MTRPLTTEQLKAEMIEKIAVASGLRARDGRNVVAEAIYAEVVGPLLAHREAQPVAWRHDDGPFAGMVITRSKSVADSWMANGWAVTPLFPAPPVPAVPDESVDRDNFENKPKQQ
ncbi:valyl-tRNA synthetase [Serratia bockelmannii]|uniref:valyl-tRNA synthetase n=1 Tax=Serratia bockelmannii TaxID=2703793 RepID=UPI003FA6A88D